MKSHGLPVPKLRRRTAGPVGRAIEAFLRFSPLYNLANFLTAVRFFVQGDSMLPNFAQDQYILVSRMAYLWDGPSRGDVVVLRHPRQQGRNYNYIKRVVGLPGEHVRVEGGLVFINGQLLEEPYLNGVPIPSFAPSPFAKGGLGGLGKVTEVEGESRHDQDVSSLSGAQYFVMGDNRANSDDSRSFGPVDRRLIVGKAWVRYWPRSAWGIIR